MFNLEFTLNRSGPIGGFAYGIFVNALIGLPLFDRIYFPSNLLPLESVTRRSSDVIVKTKPNKFKHRTKIATVALHIFNRTV